MGHDSFLEIIRKASVKSLLCGLMLLSPLASIAGLQAAEWSPGKAPLMTRWAKDVSPDRSHPEYPRPQMVRADWLNLNGLWQAEFGKADGNAPVRQKHFSMYSLRNIRGFMIQPSVGGLPDRPPNPAIE